MRCSYSFIAAYQSGQRHRLWRRKGSIPTRAMLYGVDGLSIGVCVLKGLPVHDKLLGNIRMLPFGETLKLFCAYRARQAKLLRKLSLPLALHLLSLTPVVLVRRGEFALVVVL